MHYYYDKTLGKETYYHTLMTGNFVWIVLAGLFAIWSVFIVYVLNTFALKKFHEKKMLSHIPDRFKPFRLLYPEKLNHLEVFICGIFLLPIRICLIVMTLTFHIIVIKIILIITGKSAQSTYYSI